VVSLGIEAAKHFDFVEPIVAVARLMTTESRMPPRMTGRASGSSTRKSRCIALMPMPSAASSIEAGTCRRPETVFSKIGSNP